MRKLSVALLGLLVGLVPFVVTAQEVTGGSLQEIAASVVMIETVEGRRAVSGGTGTIISADGRIYTNQHVIEGGNDFAIFMLDDDLGEQPELRYYASLEYVSNELDFAILQIDRDNNGNSIDAARENLPYLPPSHDKEVSIGDTVRIFGYPGIGDGYMIITSGEIVAVQNGNIRGQRFPVWYRTDAEISGGNSGGLAVNENGEFIGLPTWVVSEERTAGRLGGILPISAVEISLADIPPQRVDTPATSNGGSTLTLVNSSDLAICSAYVAPTTANTWGENQLGTAQVNGGGSFVWDFPVGIYDILLIGCNGRTLEDFRNITVSGSTVFTFMPDGNSTFEAGEAAPPATAPSGVSLTIVNSSDTPICYVYISATTATSWGADQLDSNEIIGGGQSRAFDVEPNDYDVLLQDCQGETLSDTRGLDLTTGSRELAYP